MLAHNRIIPLQHILVEGIPQVADFVRNVVNGDMTCAVTIPLGKATSPAIFNRDKVAARLRFARHNPRHPGIAGWRIEIRFHPLIQVSLVRYHRFVIPWQQRPTENLRVTVVLRVISRFTHL